MLDVIKYPNPVLRQKAEPVTEFDDELRSFVNDMIDTMYIADGIGLAAPQVAVSKRLLVLDAGEGPMCLINPEIKAEADAEDHTMEEGCLSLPDIRVDITRPSKISVKAWNENGDLLQFKADELLSKVIQHENDHLNGLMIIDHISSIQRRLLRSKLAKLEKEFSSPV